MAYQKVLVDNVTCSRRFHVIFDDEDKKLDKVELRCPFCEIVVFKREFHPKAKIARQENLTQLAELSDNIINDCDFRDRFSEKTLPMNAQSSGLGND